MQEVDYFFLENNWIPCLKRQYPTDANLSGYLSRVEECPCGTPFLFISPLFYTHSSFPW